jgi:hypothetical protein
MPDVLRFPKTVHVDNGRPFLAMELEIRQLRDRLKLKSLESQCLAEISQRQATVISVQETMSKLLEERLYQALNRFHPLQKKVRRA